MPTRSSGPPLPTRSSEGPAVPTRSTPAGGPPQPTRAPPTPNPQVPGVPVWPIDPNDPNFPQDNPSGRPTTRPPRISVIGIPDPRCPMTQSDPMNRNPVQLPHESNCERFYKCDHGLAFEYQCPVGQHWNAARNYCDFPNLANCGGSHWNNPPTWNNPPIWDNPPAWNNPPIWDSPPAWNPPNNNPGWPQQPPQQPWAPQPPIFQHPIEIPMAPGK